MDDMDQVQPHIDAFNVCALDQQQRYREPDDNNGPDCIDCFEEIPLKRRLAKPGCRRCVACQELLENWREL